MPASASSRTPSAAGGPSPGPTSGPPPGPPQHVVLPAGNGSISTRPESHGTATENTPGRGPVGRTTPAKKGGWGWLFWLLALAAIGGGAYWGYRTYGLPSFLKPPATRRGEGQQPRTVPVVAATAVRGDLPIYLRNVGTVTALNTVTLHSRVDGQLVKVAFKEGEVVQKDQLLVEIDPRPFEAVVAQMEGQKARDQASLDNAQRDLTRYEIAKEAVPVQLHDTAQAQVEQFQAAIKVDDAQINAAKLQLGYTKITAPITGRIGLRNVDEGNIVHASDTTGLAVITQVQPISVVFTLAQDNLPTVQKALREEKTVPVTAFDSMLVNTLGEGTLVALDNQIDVTSGTFRLKANFENTENALYPNQFVNVRMLVDTRKNVVLVPVTAVQRSPQSTFVYVIKPDHTVEVREVKTGPDEGGLEIVEKGVEAGEQVVVEGLDQLRQGSKVTIQSGAATETSANGETATEPDGGGGTTRPSRGRGRGRGGASGRDRTGDGGGGGAGM